ncbi:hypothetical protein LshimejAT787_1002610 [Lyophyllum shimeji]|uniref:Methyltransferase ausD n=1 Tax=Lyophyllum shimeji TaxID=47721 RepID=A0A9P3PTZ7_LYOSH|nr:hypothetical protein LshimejAT787_1002610 [Lyophyllum shimeji]
MTALQEKHAKLPLDEKFYALEGKELAFFQEQTGIKDEAELKQHIISVQTKAYEVFEYRCIRSFGFTRLKISRLPAYQEALKLAQQRPGALFLDIGCCFGNDVRKIVADGWPVENAIASDLHQEFWNYGHELFRSTPTTFPATFIGGDAFDSAFLAPRKPFYSPEEPAPLTQPLRSLTSLTPLRGHMSTIHASSFFHLFDEPQQLELARRLATLLSASPGSMIFGVHGGRPEKGLRTEALNSAGKYMFCHSPETWRDLWDGVVFKKGTVKVECGLHPMERPDLPAAPEAKFYGLWCSAACAGSMKGFQRLLAKLCAAYHLSTCHKKKEKDWSVALRTRRDDYT